MWIWVRDPNANVGWMRFEEHEPYFEQQARRRCAELSSTGLRTALHDLETGGITFDPLPRFYG